MNLRPLQEAVDNWIQTNGIRYYNELTNLAILTEEVGEVARIIARRYGEQSFKATDNHNLAEELADVLFVLTCIANQTNIDLTIAFEQNLAKKARRDKERHQNNAKLRA